MLVVKRILVPVMLAVLFCLTGCFRPKILDAYWAIDEEGTNRASPDMNVDYGSVVYAWVLTENADGTNLRVVIQEYDLIGEDEDCVDTLLVVKNDRASFAWHAGAGDSSWPEGTRKYYVTAVLGGQTVFSDNIVVEPE